ncbi:hypothetical protein BU23DRAFT_558335, partial [Bimuria novae-zelandiae CBS 107.79]
ALIIFRRHYGLSFPKISTVFSITDLAAGKAYRRVENATEGDSLQALLAAAPNSRGQQLRHNITVYGTYRVHEAVQHGCAEADITLTEKTVLNIAREHRDERHLYAITRGVRPKKPALDSNDEDERLEHYAWLKAEYNLHFPHLIFQRISRPVGRDSNLYAAPATPPKFNLMTYAATSTDTICAYQRPCL